MKNVKFALAFVIVVNVMLVSCNSPQRTVSEPSNNISDVSSQSNPSTLRSLVLRLETAPDRAAVELLKAIAANPEDKELRLRLAARYRETNHYTLSSLYEMSARVLNGGADENQPVAAAQEVSWICPVHEASVYEVIKRSDQYLDGRQPDRARREVDLGLEQSGLSCPLLFQQAYVTVYRLAYDSEPSGWDDRERSVRLGVSIGDEVGPHSAKVAHFYDLLATYFYKMGDIASAYVAALTAVARTPEDDGPARTSQRSKIADQIQNELRSRRK